MGKKLTVVLALVLLYNIFYFPFHFPSPGRFDFLLIVFAALAAAWISLYEPGESSGLKRLNYARNTSILSLLLATFALFRASPIDNRLLGLASLGFGGMSVYFLALQTSEFGGFFEMLFIPWRLFKSWVEESVEFYFLDREGQRHKAVHVEKELKNFVNFDFSPNLIKGILRGLLLTAPVAFIVTAFLAYSDPIFASIIEKPFQSFEFGDLVLRGVNSMLIFLVALPATALAVHQVFDSPSNHERYKSFGIEAMVMTGVLSLILSVFLFVQFKYLFAAVPETQLHQFGVQTLSEYVRRGFVELIIVAGIVYTSIGLSYTTLRHQSKTKSMVLTWLNYLLMSELALFIFSIIRRVYLYQAEHGLTRIRIYGMAFVIYLLAMVVIMALRHYYQNRQAWYLYEFGAGLVILLLLIWAKPDKLIAETYQPTVNDRIDYVHIARLSPDAIEGWEQGYDHAEELFAELPSPQEIDPDGVREVIYAQESLYWLGIRYGQLIQRYGTVEEYQALFNFESKDFAQAHLDKYGQRGFLETNLSERTTYNQLKHLVEPGELYALRMKYEDYRNRIPMENRYPELDRSFESPLL